jgi:hypothetical protein
MVGEYEEEPFSPAVRENAVDALAILHACRGLDPETIHFHKEDPRTTHTSCPGRNVDKGDLVQRVHARMMTNTGVEDGEHLANRPSGDALGIANFIAPISVPTVEGPAAGGGRFTNIAATEFGGGAETGMDSAYGGTVNPDAPEVALPAKVPASKRQIRLFSVSNGRSVVCKVNDVGPWNTRDKYWEGDGRPLAEAQHRNRTPAQNGQVPTNDAGIDLTPAVYEALGIPGSVNTRQTHVDWEFA